MRTELPTARFNRDLIQQLADRGKVVSPPAGSVIFRRFDTGEQMYIVESGEVELKFSDAQPGKRLGRGAFFGELTLLTSRHARTADAIAGEDCRLRVLDRDTFNVMLESNPRFLGALLRLTCDYLIQSEQRLIDDLYQRNAELERTLDYLRRTKSELSAAELRAMTDALTGLYNRRCLEQQVAQFIDVAAQGSAAPMALILVDLDQFKTINDTHGHPAGDEVLRTLGDKLRAELRSTDLPCRIGGDEFAAVLFDIQPAAALTRAEGFFSRLGRIEVPLVEADEVLQITLSLGGTTYQSGETLAAMTDRADRYLYQAKAGGRYRMCFDGEMIVPSAS